jgi:hypothetical protein
MVVFVDASVFLCTFCSSRLIACYLRSSFNRPRVVAAALISQILMREFSFNFFFFCERNRGYSPFGRF